MVKLLLFMLLFSKDTIVTTLVPATTATTATPAAHTTPRSPVSAALITLRILNTSSTPLKNVTLDWSLQTDGIITKKGRAPIPLLAPHKPTLVHLPLHLPDDSAGETYLQLRYLPAATAHAPNPAPPPADVQILLRPWRPRLSIEPTGEITLSDENDIFTIHSPTIRISFNRQTGWLLHYEIKGISLLDDTLGLRPNFWWPGYNDSANPHSPGSAPYTDNSDSGWLAATRQPHLQLFSNTTSPQQIIIRTEYTLPATACLLHLSYTINANGEMLITQQVEPDTTQPSSRQWPLPCFGMQWFLPPGYDSIIEYGCPAIPPQTPTSDITRETRTHETLTTTGETPTLTRETPTIPPPSDPHPRATATRTNIRWWTITDKDGNGLQFIADTPLLTESVLHLNPRLPIQLSIDRPATPGSPQEWPIPLPFGTYQYTYKVKPLVTSPPPSFHKK